MSMCVVCDYVTQKVLEHLSRAPQYYLPPDSNIYFHYRAAMKAATKGAFERPVEASRSFKNVLEQRTIETVNFSPACGLSGSDREKPVQFLSR